MIPQQISDDASVIIKASAYRGSVHDFILTVSSSSGSNQGNPSTGINAKKGWPAWKKG
jgi:hypothetical protein